MKIRGFTFIEIIVYLSIISIIAVVGIPSYRLVVKSKFNADVRNLVNDIRSIKDMTYIDGKEYKIEFSKDGYKIIDKYNAILREYKLNSGTYLKNYDLYKGSKKVNYMSYNLKGNAIASGTLIISNKNDSIQRKVSIVPVTGRVLLIGN